MKSEPGLAKNSTRSFCVCKESACSLEISDFSHHHPILAVEEEKTSPTPLGFRLLKLDGLKEGGRNCEGAFFHEDSLRYAVKRNSSSVTLEVDAGFFLVFGLEGIGELDTRAATPPTLSLHSDSA